MLHRTAATILLVGLAFYSTARGQIDTFEQPPINYSQAEVRDPVARLAERLEEGSTSLAFDETFGYLPALLAELEVPSSSQTLVFSKTSLQLHRISPRRPRALYFNDDVYVGYCQRGDVLELAATDPEQGAIFYTLEQSAESAPRLVRDRGNCLACHASSRTQDVPGYLVRSVFPDRSGRPKLGSGTFVSDHTSPFRERWGGWYVTGEHGAMRHMGNTICSGDEYDFDRDRGANQTELVGDVDPDDYLTPHSDLVALMVLAHQTQMHNAIAAANYETRRALHQSFQMNELLDRPEGFISDSARRRIRSSADRVLRYLLMCDEFPLTAAVSGTSSFRAEFAASGRRDGRGRSLRDFDLETRLFRYPCSYLIHSPAFDALPDPVREQILSRLHAILSGRDDSPEFSHLAAATRRDVLEILSDTKPEILRSADD